MNPPPDPSSPMQPASEVWPPPPSTGLPSSPAAPDVVPDSPLEIFQVKSVWLVLLLSVVTLGIYPVIWLRRQLGVIRAVRPDLVSSLVYANVVLACWILVIILAFVAGTLPSDILHMVTRVLARISGIMVLVLEFQMRNAANQLVQHDSRRWYWYSGVFTWLFGVLYLQYKINKNIQLWRGMPTSYPTGF